MKRILLLFACVLCANAPAQKFDQLALTPPMGWNSWNKFQCNITEDLIRQTADAMVASGMKDAGYEYINIDDCWHGERDAQGFIHPDAKRFPSGIKALSDYVHAKGLKLGIYSDVGYKTCGGKPASRGHEYQDAATYAEWGIDYLKYDWCNSEGLKAEGAYTTMRDALYATGRPIVFSLCEWGDNKPWLWAAKVGHLWRTTGDITACFDCEQKHGTWSSWGVLQILDKQKGLREYAGPGHWNDPDMLEVGNGMKLNEDRAHFSMWCMLAAPLIAGNDLRKMSAEVAGVLMNKEVIAIDQDALGVQGFKYSEKDGVEVWFKPLNNDAWAMCVLNRSNAAQKVTFDWKNEKVADSFAKRETHFDTTAYSARDLWAKKELGTTKETLSVEVPGHDVLMVRLTNPAATVSAVAATASAKSVIRIKTGVTAPFTDSSGNVWLPDQGFADGTPNERDVNLAIANTKDPALYRTERYGMTAFSYPLPNGKYTVKLHFAETFEELSTAGTRVFSYNVEGHEFKDFDVFVKAGGMFKAYVETVNVEVKDGKLDITFTNNIENPVINGLEIIPVN